MMICCRYLATEASGVTRRTDGVVQVHTEHPVQMTTRATSSANFSASASATRALTATTRTVNTTWSNDTSSNSSADVVSSVSAIINQKNPPYRLPYTYQASMKLTSTTVLQIRNWRACCVFARQTFHFHSIGGSTAFCCVKGRHGRHFENVMSNRKSDSVSRCILIRGYTRNNPA